MLDKRQEESWQDGIHRALSEAKVGVVGYVPDGGHRQLIARCVADPAMRTISLTTEQEGIGLAAGAWLGGVRSVLLMQSSGVGNCINALSLIQNCRFPFLTIVTMRGDFGESNNWQMAMGQATRSVFESMGTRVLRAETPAEVAEAIPAATAMAFNATQSVAVLLSQRLIGAKQFK